MRQCSIGFALVLSLWCAERCLAQPFVIVGTDQKSYPTLSATVIAFDNAGTLQVLGASDIGITQDAQQVTGTTTCEGQTNGRLLSLMVLADVSASTVQGSPTAMDLQKAGAKAGEVMLASTGDERGLSSYDASTSLLLGLTTNRVRFASAVDSMTAGRGSRLAEGMNNVPFGALSQLQNARNGRALLVFTDGATSIDLAATLAKSKTFGVQIYIIGLKTTLSQELRDLADSSNGAWVDNISTPTEAAVHARAFVAHAKRLPTCTVTWTAPVNCRTQHRVDLRRGSLTRTVTIKVPVGNRTILSASTTGVDFSEVAPGASLELDLMLTARNGAVTISNIQSTDPHFVITLGSVPPALALQNNAAHTVRIRYTATDSNVRVVKLNVTSDACESTPVYLRGGFVANDNELRMVTPNGGETFLAGRSTPITWSGVLPTDLVRLESSIDDGATWSSIDESVSGLTYDWIPAFTTTRARIRVQRTAIDATKIVTMSGQHEPVYSSDFTSDGKSVVTGGDDGTVRLYDAVTGSLSRIVGTHTDWVWSVATHPTRQYVASGSHDGTVRIWDYTTGARAATIPIGSKVWSVAFSSNGQILYVGSSESVAAYNTTNWSIITKSSVVSGIVYSVLPSADGSTLAVAEGDVATTRNATTLIIVNTFRGHSGNVYSAALSPDKNSIVTGGADLSVRLWNTANGTQTARSAAASGSILSVRYSKTGGRILVGGGDGTAKFYSAANLSLLGTLSGHKGLVYSARYDLTDRYVTTASTDFTARVWDVLGLRQAEDQSDASFTIKGGLGGSAVADLGLVTLGEGADAMVLLLRNNANDTLLVNGIRIASGDVQDFDLIANPLVAVVAPGGELRMEVAFTPIEVGTRTAVVEFNTGTGIVRSTVTGTGVLPALDAPTIVDFGRIIANQEAADTTVVVSLQQGSNTPITVNDVILGGPDAAQYSIVNGGGSFTVSQGQSRAINLRFEPKDLGRFPATLTLVIAGGRNIVVRIYGEGTGDAAIQAVPSVTIPSSLCGSAGQTSETFTITNGGNSTLQIYAIGIEGVNAAEFTADVGDPLPVDVASGGTRTVTVRFSPTSTGSKQARLVLTTNAVNAPFGVTVIPIVARKDTAAFELSRMDVLFDNVPEGTSAIERILLLNTGTVTLRWPKGPIDLGSFRIESITPEIVGPGKQAEVVIRFLSGTAGQVYSASYRFVDSVCGRTIDLNMSATVKTYVGFTIRIDSINALTGVDVSVPVYITKRVNFDRTQERTVSASISTNATLLLPTGATPIGTIESGSVRRFTITLPVPETDSLSTNLQFKTFWGNDSSAFIRIDSISVADTLLITTVDGRVLLTDICREGGARLVSVQQTAAVKSSPQPMSSDGTIRVTLSERGAMSMVLTDVNGRMVLELFDKNMSPGSYDIPIDASMLESGAYFLLLTTPTQRIAHRLDILK
ncbi:MAG: choice-of-anchor D domain-containing protein [bacterium]|nr:choice-of-anchor D domain-containing protein [bacterium]